MFVAILTAGAYWLTFRYEVGYLSGFGLPPDIVEVSLQTTLIVALALSGAIWIVFSILNVVLILWPEHPAIQMKVFRIILMLLIPLWHLLNYGFRAQDWIFYVVFFVFVGVFEIIWPLLVFRKEPTLRERFIADEIAEAPVMKRGIASRIFAAFGPAAYGLFVLLILGGSLAHTAGRAKASTQREYFVFADAPDIAVVRMYHDTILAVPYDKKTRTVKAQVIIRKIGTENVKLMLDVDAGPLKQRKNMVPAKPEGSTSGPNP